MAVSLLTVASTRMVLVAPSGYAYMLAQIQMSAITFSGVKPC
jgi:hypothetical protein